MKANYKMSVFICMIMIFLTSCDHASVEKTKIPVFTAANEVMVTKLKPTITTVCEIPVDKATGFIEKFRKKYPDNWKTTPVETLLHDYQISIGDTQIFVTQGSMVIATIDSQRKMSTLMHDLNNGEEEEIIAMVCTME